MIDLLEFFCPPGKYSVPVGVTQQPGGDAIYQVEHDAATRTFHQMKGTHGVPAESQAHGYTDAAILFYGDNSRKDGVPYAQRDDLTKRGAVWCNRRQNVGGVTERSPYLLELDPATGVAKVISQTPVRTWLKLAAHHRDWQSANGGPVIDQVVVLEWYLDAALTVLEETYVYGRDDKLGALGLIEFRHRDQSAWPNHVWFAAPPAERVPVLARKPMPVDSVRVTPTTPVVSPPVVTPPATAAELMVRADITAGANVRREPTTRSATFATLPRLTAVDVVRFVPGGDGDGFRWAERAQGGYVREDLLGPRSAPAVIRARFRCPVDGPYSVTSRHLEKGHKGIDLAAAKGTPVVAGGVGQVAWLYQCVKCRTLGETWAAAGIVSEAQKALAFNDPDWGYGYGDSVVVRYAYGDLPDAARAELDRQGLTGGYVYVVHAHLDEIAVEPGQCVGPNTVLGTVGQDANSSGPHLHLEPRASLKPDESSVYNRTLLDPALIFAL